MRETREYPEITISVFCWEIMLTIAIIVLVIERAIVVGFREEQLWPFVSSGGTLDDTGDLSPQLPLVVSQENSLI